MDILSLELYDLTAFQALVELRRVLEEHPETTLRASGDDETVRMNVIRFLEKEGRPVKVLREARPWQLEVAGGARPSRPLVPTVPLVLETAPAPLPVLVPQPLVPRPVMLLRSAFAPGDRALGRRLLLDLLRNLDAQVAWLGLAHEALDLLEDPISREVLQGLQARGLRIRISVASLAYLGRDGDPFEVMEDLEWQGPAGRGELTLF
jgi:hypothetical protein